VEGVYEHRNGTLDQEKLQKSVKEKAERRSKMMRSQAFSSAADREGGGRTQSRKLRRREIYRRGYPLGKEKQHCAHLPFMGEISRCSRQSPSSELRSGGVKLPWDVSRGQVKERPILSMGLMALMKDVKASCIGQKL